MATVGEALVKLLEQAGVEVVFGIPGVHTVELYRGLAGSSIRHVTARHEQGIGFMADGYARTSGKPGVGFVITGPGLTNALTPMAQSRADSVPVLMLSGVNRTASLGKGLGDLHELPDQKALSQTVCLISKRVEKASDLEPAVNEILTHLETERPGPCHIEIPIDVMGEAFDLTIASEAVGRKQAVAKEEVLAVCNAISVSQKPVIIAGGGAKSAADELAELAQRIDSPVILTTNARGIMHKHDLVVSASPSLESVRDLIRDADLVLAIGAEFGQTDFDMNADNNFPKIENLIRIDICSDQLVRVDSKLKIKGASRETVEKILNELPVENKQCNGSERASQTRENALNELSSDMATCVEILDTIRDAVPNSIIVGDSTQAIYAGNLYYSADRPGGWFNAATGYGALGFGIPAAIGASIAAPDVDVICITGDGGAQFTLPELMTAVDEKLPIRFVIWNNSGFFEIER